MTVNPNTRISDILNDTSRPTITIDQLIIEVTRKCNMSCKHCLRGDSQNMDMSMSILPKLLVEISQIDSITFTGGEPSLNIAPIAQTLHLVKQFNIPVHHFYLVTNAKEYNQEMVNMLNDWYTYCCQSDLYSYDETELNSLLQPTDRLPYVDTESKEMCGLAISHDKFHDPIKLSNYMQYATLPYYQHDKEEKEDNPTEYLIKRGRAIDNGIGTPRSIARLYADIDDMDNPSQIQIFDDLYVSANGNITSDCDLSYAEIDSESYGNINDDLLRDIIIRQTKTL